MTGFASKHPDPRVCVDRTRRGAPLLVVLAAIGITLTPAFAADEPAPIDLASMKAQYQRPAGVPFPTNNPYSEAKAELGRQLFFDARLSGSATMSCSSCHDPALSWSDGVPINVGSAGHRLARHSPSILNVAWAETLLWDGRARSLEQQAAGAIQSPEVMNQSMPALVSVISATPAYRNAFDTAFPGEPVSAGTIARAIATFERTVVSGDAPFDRWIGGEETAINEAAKRGFVTFNTKAHCADCHSGWRFSDDSFHDIGLPDADPGRAKVVPDDGLLLHAFKTPGLRNIATRAPYMHNGSMASMTEVVHHYDHGFVERAGLAPEIHRLELTDQEVSDLLDFMTTLTSPDGKIPAPVVSATNLTVDRSPKGDLQNGCGPEGGGTVQHADCGLAPAAY